MRSFPGNALLTACALALTACNDDPPPPRPFPADTEAPTVTATSPAESAEGLLPGATTEVSITFSEPMNPEAGTLVPSGGLTLGTATWSDRTLKVPVTSIRHDDAHALELKGFRDVAGNALDGTAFLGDGRLDFRTTSDRPRPAVASASPAEGTQELYPVEMYYDASASRPGTYFHKVLTVTFTEAMNPAFAQVELVNRTDSSLPPRALTGQWSPDGLTLTVRVSAPDEGGPPLEEESAYTLDLSALRSAAVGNRLDATPVLGDGKLDFTTGKRDGHLEHACTHTLASTAEALTAAPARPPFGFPPPTGVGHTRYRLTLPGEGPHEGYTELISKPAEDEDIVLYLGQELQVGAYDDLDGFEVLVELRAAPPACAGITHRARFSAAMGNRSYMLHFGPTDATTLEFVLERYAK
ncbi:Ig-like domain-containing protein [Archangium violaceum]|uniref:Ig-like domain-containing protein n=1 Tax=Archangium violaceum TaxID=83451 RepID=UPI0019526BFB|nr:Ig-like domain-containing protein [Archangium violaceum]QRO00258.1 Ig-like domain-containing protein [Archangium violaceum]